jgi:hypothetical protein
VCMYCSFHCSFFRANELYTKLEGGREVGVAVYISRNRIFELKYLAGKLYAPSNCKDKQELMGCFIKLHKV